MIYVGGLIIKKKLGIDFKITQFAIENCEAG